MQFITLGMHRSGTSSVTRLMNMMGAYVGDMADLVEANDENPKGFWERHDVINANNRLLENHHNLWYYLNNWPYNAMKSDIETPEDVSHIIRRLDASKPWVIKDPRLCHTLPLWQSALPEGFLIIVHRNPIEIATSLKTRNKFSLQHGLALWEYAAVGMINAARHFPHHIINYADLLSNPVETTQKLHQAVAQHCAALTMPSEEDILSFIDPSLYRSKADDSVLTLNESQQTLCRYLTSGNLPNDDVIISDYAERIMREITNIVPLMKQRDDSTKTLGHATSTIKQQEDAIKQLMIERDAEIAQRKLQDIEIGRLHGIIADKQEEIQRYTLIEIERDTIKQTRWWKLRSWLRHEDGIRLRDVLTRSQTDSNPTEEQA